MRNSRPLYWNQGLFLTPQHLQQQDLFHQWNQQAAWRLSRPFGWGVASLQIREEGLKNSELEILSCEIVTREGLILQAGSEGGRANANVATRSFGDLLSPAGPPLSVFLGVPGYRAGQSNVAPDGSGDGTPLGAARYRIFVEERPDLFEKGAPDVDVNFVVHNLIVLFDRDDSFAQLAQSLSPIKIAEILPSKTGVGGTLSPDYIPPCLSIAASPPLLHKLKDLRDLVTARGQEFAEFGRRRGVRASARGPHDVLRVLMITSLNRFIPMLHHLTEHGTVHPETVYGLLREMIGELSAYSEEVSALGASQTGDELSRPLPPYDHDNINLCFGPAFTQLRKLVAAMATGPEMGINLEYDGEYYRASLPAAVFEGERTRYYLMIEARFEGAELWERLQNTGKIAAGENMPQIRKSWIMGLAIDFLPVPPEELPHRGGRSSYFLVDTKSEHWLRIKQFNNIAVYCRDLDPDETAIKIYVVPNE